VGYAAKAGKAGGLAIDPDLAVGLAIPVVALVGLALLRRARRALRKPEAENLES